MMYSEHLSPVHYDITPVQNSNPQKCINLKNTLIVKVKLNMLNRQFTYVCLCFTVFVLKV